MIQSNVIPKLPSGYNIEQSLRFNDDDSAYLSRTPSVAGNRKTWTFSTWVKRGNIGQTSFFINAKSDSNNYTTIGFNSSNQLDFIEVHSGSVGARKITTQLFRDVGAYYYLEFVWDTTNATASDRMRIYVNGERVTSFSTSTDPAINYLSYFNSAVEHRLGYGNSGTNNFYFDGYLAETNFIDGQALTPDSFGEFDETYGHWKPKKYSGTYGTNGFYLPYGNGANIGEDNSGNGNNFTATNLSATDIVLDSPTNNFATLNVLVDNVGASNTYSEGSLKAFTISGGQAYGTIGTSGGKYYCEMLLTSLGSQDYVVGISKTPKSSGTTGLTYSGGYSWGVKLGRKYEDGVITTEGSTAVIGDIIGIAFNVSSGTLDFYKNGIIVPGMTIQDILNDNYFFGALYGGGNAGNDSVIANFGQDSSFAGNKTPQGNTDANGIGDFYYQPPEGYLALCTKNLPEPTVVPSENFNVVTYVGNESDNSYGNLEFSPDFLWIKNRTTSSYHMLNDIVRGDVALHSDQTLAEQDTFMDIVRVSDGITFNGSTTWGNKLNNNYVAWNWKAGGTPVVNNDGTIQSLVSANVDAGFSIVGYTEGTVFGGTIGHGLYKAPELTIFKNRESLSDWLVVTTVIDGSEDYLFLNKTNAKIDTSGFNPNSTTIVSPSNTGDDRIAYCFHSVEGYSKIGSYVGNGSADGTFVYCGFRPKYVMIKRAIGGTDSWAIFDDERDNYNYINKLLRAEASNAEADMTSLVSNPFGDFTSNGFKIRNTSTIDNASGNTYIFVAFAEHPMKYSNAR